jgi:DNA-binding transcriptional ArsR family regulator
LAEVGVTFRALSDPSRRLILQRLSHGPATSGQLAALLTTSRPAASQHLAHLGKAGLVTSTIIGRHRWHELAPSALYELERWVRLLVETWAGSPPLDVSSLRRPPSQLVNQKERPHDPAGHVRRDPQP